MRTCPRCEVGKPASAFANHSWCRDCTREYNRERRRNPSVRQNELAYTRAWHEANPTYRAEWCEANRERVRASSEKWRTNNPEAALRRSREWRQRNPDKVAAFPSSSRAVRKKYEKAYRDGNRERVREKVRRRRAILMDAYVVPFTAAQLKERLSMFPGCWICGGEKEEVDHVKPLAKGGLHVLANLRPSCASCNRSKRDVWPFHPDK